MPLKNSLSPAIEAIAKDIKQLKNESTGTAQLTKIENLLKTYIQSRNGGLISNGYGLMKSNYNFPGTTFTAADFPVGFGCFYSDVQNDVMLIEELIPYDKELTYKVSFHAKTMKSTGTNNAYFLMQIFDIDGLLITPFNIGLLSFTIDKINNKTITINPADRDAFDTLYNNQKSSSIPFYVMGNTHKANTGYQYPEGTYSREEYVKGDTFSSTTWNKSTGEWTIPDLQTIKSITPNQKYMFTLANATYFYPLPAMQGTNIPNKWTKYSFNMKLSTMSLTDYFKRLINTGSFFKIGWWVNRGVPAGNRTGVGGVDIQVVG